MVSFKNRRSVNWVCFSIGVFRHRWFLLSLFKSLLFSNSLVLCYYGDRSPLSVNSPRAGLCQMTWNYEMSLAIIVPNILHFNYEDALRIILNNLIVSTFRSEIPRSIFQSRFQIIELLLDSAMIITSFIAIYTHFLHSSHSFQKL